MPKVRLVPEAEVNLGIFNGSYREAATQVSRFRTRYRSSGLYDKLSSLRQTVLAAPHNHLVYSYPEMNEIYQKNLLVVRSTSVGSLVENRTKVDCFGDRSKNPRQSSPTATGKKCSHIA